MAIIKFDKQGREILPDKIIFSVQDGEITEESVSMSKRPVRERVHDRLRRES